MRLGGDYPKGGELAGKRMGKTVWRGEQTEVDVGPGRLEICQGLTAGQAHHGSDVHLVATVDELKGDRAGADGRRSANAGVGRHQQHAPPSATPHNRVSPALVTDCSGSDRRYRHHRYSQAGEQDQGTCWEPNHDASKSKGQSANKVHASLERFTCHPGLRYHLTPAASDSSTSKDHHQASTTGRAVNPTPRP